MSEGEFTATHRVPDAGIDTWSAPDPSRHPDNRIDPGLPVQVLESTTGWARVRASNGWEAWVDEAKLVGLTEPASSSAATSTGFAPTHRVSASGADARDRPDMAEPVVARLDGSLPVSIVNTWGGWAKVHFENGWEAWADARTIIVGSAPAAAAPTAVSPLALWLPIIGAAIAIVGGFLDWFPQTPAWDLGFVGLFTHKGLDLANNDFSGGLVLLLSAGAAIPLVTRRPLPRWWAVAFAGVATNVAVMGFVLYFDVKVPGLSIGAGMFITLLGGVTMAIGALMSPRRSPRPALAT